MVHAATISKIYIDSLLKLLLFPRHLAMLLVHIGYSKGRYLIALLTIYQYNVPVSSALHMCQRWLAYMVDMPTSE